MSNYTYNSSLFNTSVAAVEACIYDYYTSTGSSDASEALVAMVESEKGFEDSKQPTDAEVIAAMEDWELPECAEESDAAWAWDRVKDTLTEEEAAEDDA